MSEVAGPTSPLELCGPQRGDMDPSFSTAGDDIICGVAQPQDAEGAAEEAEPSVDASKDTMEPPPAVTPEGSPASPPELSKPDSSMPPPPTTSTVPATTGQDFLTSNRRRVVSLDRGHELRRVVSLDRGRELLCEMDGMNSSSDLSNAADDLAVQNGYGDDDGSLGSNSSDGESSYFAKHLPSPKSGRRWSYSDAASTSSAPARAGPYARGGNGRESDASLSFSDDEDDESGRPGMKIITSRTPMLPPPVPREGSDDLPPYPQRITRIHSMGSLVSSSSDDGKGGVRDRNRPLSRNSSNGSLSSEDGTATTSSDPSVRAELRHVAIPNAERRASSGTAPPASGRLPPVLGAHYPGFLGGGYMQTPPSAPQMSPPLIYQGQPPPTAQDVAHPQPMTSDQMAAWLAAGNVPMPSIVPPPFFPPPGYGAVLGSPTDVPPQHDTKSPSDAVNSSVNSGDTAGDRTLTMVYSEDEETDDGNPGHKTARNRKTSGRQESREVPFNSATGGGLGTGLEGGGNVAESHDFLGMGMYGANSTAAPKVLAGSQDHASGDGDGDGEMASSQKGFKVYWRRWLMLMYMSVLNLLSDWTCYSVAPISLLTSEAFGNINPEQLVVVFLGANAVATACEPIILSRLGLRRTVVFGAMLLMIGSIVKSGGLPPILEPTLTKGKGEWRVYLGFFLVGLSQPLYQCTPALLSASWFPERERTMATGVALNANQLGIGFAFIFGTLLVATSDDIVPYFGLLSFIATVTFLGCLFQFDDAPPTPPSDTARVMRGTFQMKLPGFDSILKSVRSFTSLQSLNDDRSERERSDSNQSGSRKSQPSEPKVTHQRRSSRRKSGKKARRRSSSGSHKSATESPRPSSRKQATPAPTVGAGTRRRSSTSRNRSATSESGLVAAPGLAPPPSPASSSRAVAEEIGAFEREAYRASVLPPSRMMPGPVGPVPPANSRSEEEPPLYEEDDYQQDQTSRIPPDASEPAGDSVPHAAQYQYPAMGIPMGYQQPQWQQGYWDPQYQQQPPLHHPAYQQQPSGYFQQQAYQQQGYYYYPQGYFYPQMHPPFSPHDYQQGGIPNTSDIDEGAEPTLTVSDSNLDINIRDDQIILSTRACLSRPGFIHALVAFTVSGIVINTLSTFMDYLVRLNGAGREYVGIVGGSFQFVIMISSLIIGKATDRTRAYYSVIIAMLVLGAFGLAECGVSLDADRGSDLRWTLIVVAALVGPLQPVSTELGVDVVYPLSENTVLVIQQLFSNLLSAMFIPFFKALKDVGTESIDDTDLYERPEYTFSFYLLIVLHAAATVFFATFNGRYIRYEQEMAKKAQDQAKMMMFAGPTAAFHPVNEFENYHPHVPYEEQDETGEPPTERQPLLNTLV